MDYKARFYSPYINRFLQPDTIIPDLSNPQSWNRFSYTANNPVLYNDPDGHCAPACPVIVLLVGIVALTAVYYATVPPPPVVFNHDYKKLNPKTQEKLLRLRPDPPINFPKGSKDPDKSTREKLDDFAKMVKDLCARGPFYCLMSALAFVGGVILGVDAVSGKVNPLHCPAVQYNDPRCSAETSTTANETPSPATSTLSPANTDTSTPAQSSTVTSTNTATPPSTATTNASSSTQTYVPPVFPSTQPHYVQWY